MADKVDQKANVTFVVAKPTLRAGLEIPCTFCCHAYVPSKDDRIGVFRTDDLDENHSYSIIPASDALSTEDETYIVLLEGSRLSNPGEYDYEFRYIKEGKEVLGRSQTFKFAPMMSEDNLLVVREISSFDDSTLLVNKLSSQCFVKMEEENRTLRDELVSMKHRVKERDFQIMELQKDSEKLSADLKTLMDRQVNMNSDYDEILKQNSEQLSTINGQITTIQELENRIKKEEAIKLALDEEVESQRSLFEAGLSEVEDSKSLAVRYKVAYRKALEKFEEDRLLYEETIFKLEQELINVRKANEEEKGALAGKVQELKESLVNAEDRLQEKLKTCLTLEEEIARLCNEINSQSEKSEESKAKTMERSSSTDEFVPAKPDSSEVRESSKNENAREEKNESNEVMESIQDKISKLEEENMKYKEELERKAKKWRSTEKRLQEMEELVSASKRELVQLERAVDANLSETDFQNRSSQTEGMSKAERDYSCREVENKEYRKRDNVRGNRRRTYTKVDKQMYGRVYTRRTERPYEEQQNNRRRSQNISALDRAALEKQYYTIRQHRNSLLRYNAKLRHSIGMLNHDCSILQYNLQQILADAEHRIANFQALYYKKDSECAILEAQVQTLLSQTDVYCQSESACDDEYALSYTPASQVGSYMDPFGQMGTPAYMHGSQMYRELANDIISQDGASQEPAHHPVIIEMNSQNDEESIEESTQSQEQPCGLVMEKN